MKLSLTVKTAVVVIIAGAMIINIVSIACQQSFSQLEISQLVTSTQSTIGTLDSIYSLVSQLDDEEQRYIDDSSLAHRTAYQQAIAKAQNSVVQLQSVGVDPTQKPVLSALNQELLDRLKHAKQLLDQSAGTGSSPVKASTVSKELSSSIRRILNNLKIYENRLLSENSQRLQMSASNNLFGMNLLMTIVLALLLMVLMLVAQYVRERQEAEESLRKAENRFKAVFNQTFQFTNLLSPQGNLLESSRTALDFAGLTQAEVLGKPFWDMPWWQKDAQTKERLKRAITEAAAGNFVRLEEEQVGTDGTVTVDVSVKPVRDDEGKIIMLIPEARDITERKQAERALAEREARMRAIFDTAPDGIITIAEDGTIESANDAMALIFGYATNELIGKNINQIIANFMAATEEKYFPKGLGAGKSEVFGKGREVVGHSSDGHPIPVELAVSALDLGDRQILTAIVRDITERKEAEKRVSEFYSTVSHELRTPLTSIRTALGLMETMGRLPGKANQLIRIARSESDRLIRLINDILDIRKIESGKLVLKIQSTQPQQLIDTTFDALRSIAKESGIRLISDVKEPGELRCDCDRIVQVLTNLVSNAIRFSPRDGKVTVRVEKNAAGNSLRFSVVDEGPGIAADQVHKLWDRFQQLDNGDSAKGGSGLGLAITKALVAQHSGFVGVVTAPGKGSAFWFELPRKGVRQIEVADASQSASRHCRILLIENDEDVVDLLNGLLSSAGYDLQRAATIAEADRILSEGRPDVVMLDIQLPDGNGFDLMTKLVLNHEQEALPIVVLPGREPALHTMGNPVLIDWIINPTDNEHLRRCLAVAARRSVLDKMKVLVVADNAETQELLSARLRSLNVEVVESGNAPVSRQMLRAQTPDLIVLDIEVKQQVCFDVFQALRQEKVRPIPLVVYAGKGLHGEDLDKLTLAFSRHLSKTHMSEPEFLGAVRELLDGRLRATAAKV